MEGETHPLQELMTGLRQIDINLSSEAISRRVILLMGQTKAGKTTLYYYLSGKKLILEKNQNGVWQLFPEAMFFNASIGNSHESETVYPNIPPLISEDDVMVIDMPGFDDSRHIYRLLNIAILLKTLKLLRQVHVCHVIPFQCIESDLLVQQFQKTSELFNKDILKKGSNLSFIITKVQEENAPETFLKQIDDILEEHILEELQDDMKAFKTKNIYEFWSKLPEVEQGLKLIQRIISQNTFLDTNHTPSTILSENYSLQMVGKSNLDQFSDYLMEIIDHIEAVLQPLILTFTNIVIFELQPILSNPLRYKAQLTLESIVENISTNVVKIKVYKLQEFVFEVNGEKQANGSICMAFLKCLKKPTSQDVKHHLASHFLSFGDIIATIRRQKSQLKEDLLFTIQNCLKEMSSLILLIKQVKIEKVQQRLDEITDAQAIKILVKEHYKFWELNQSVVTSSSQFGRFSNNQEAIKLMSELGISVDGQDIIEIVRKYSEPRNKEIKKLISRQMNQKFPQGESKVQLEDYIQLSPETLKNKLNQLPVSSSSLAHLKKQLQHLKERPEKTSIKSVLDKMSYIFYSFSYFEETIMFKMCINDENTLFDLFQEGISQEYITPQFTKAILLPYYSKINPDLSKLEHCYNYLTRFTFQQHQLAQIQRSRLQSIDSYLSNPQNAYLMSDRYKKIEFYYIQPILQNFQYYLQEIKRKRSLFMKSPISSFTSFINEKVRQ